MRICSMLKIKEAELCDEVDILLEIAVMETANSGTLILAALRGNVDHKQRLVVQHRVTTAAFSLSHLPRTSMGI
jgi:hypothetical protein